MGTFKGIPLEATLGTKCNMQRLVSGHRRTQKSFMENIVISRINSSVSLRPVALEDRLGRANHAL